MINWEAGVGCASASHGCHPAEAVPGLLSPVAADLGPSARVLVRLDTILSPSQSSPDEPASS